MDLNRGWVTFASDGAWGDAWTPHIGPEDMPCHSTHRLALAQRHRSSMVQVLRSPMSSPAQLKLNSCGDLPRGGKRWLYHFSSFWAMNHCICTGSVAIPSLGGVACEARCCIEIAVNPGLEGTAPFEVTNSVLKGFSPTPRALF